MIKSVIYATIKQACKAEMKETKETAVLHADTKLLEVWKPHVLGMQIYWTPINKYEWQQYNIYAISSGETIGSQLTIKLN